VTNDTIHICIALSALGNLIGVVFTNGRVKRDVAKSRLIPFYKYFSMSSDYGKNTWDGLGTPTCGLILHGLMSCITIAATPFYPNSTEGITFVTNIYTYHHAVLRIFLALGLFYLKKRMDQYETGVADARNRAYEVPWSYNVMKNRWIRYLAVGFFFAANGVIVGIPFDPSKKPDRSQRHIPTWVLPVIALSVYLAGALFAVYILCFVQRLWFRQSGGPTEGEHGLFVNYHNRRWIIEYPDLFTSSGWQQAVTPLPRPDIRKRFVDNGEARTAKELRDNFNQTLNPPLTQ